MFTYIAVYVYRIIFCREADLCDVVLLRCTVTFIMYFEELFFIFISFVYRLSGPWKRWGSFSILSVGHAPARRRRNGNVDGNVGNALANITEVLSEA